MMSLVRRLTTRENVILLLTLTALVCLPISLENIVRDAASSLLLPVTILGTLLTFGLASLSIKNNRVGFILIFCGPMILFIRIAQIGFPLLTTVRETLNIAGQIMVTAQGYTQSTLNFSPWISAGNLLITQAGSFIHRLLLWTAASAQNKYMEDPAARAFMWSLVLWLTAAWAGWQIKRQGKVLEGILPATILLGLILYNTGQPSGILWLFLSAVLILLGIINYQNLITPWIRHGTDFSDSIWEDSLIATLVLVYGVIVPAYMISSFSFKDMIDRMRERQTAATNSSEGSSPPVGTTSHIQSTLPYIHVILGGPALSSDVVMLVSTGEFPAMPHAVNLDVPHYYWRMMTYQTYTGSGWINQSTTNEEIPPHQMLIQVTPRDYRIVHQTVTFPTGGHAGLYWTGALVQSDTPLQIEWRALPVSDPVAAGFDPLSGNDVVGGLISGQTTGISPKYTAESLLPNVNEVDLRAAPVTYPAWVVERYLTLPDTIPERVRALARDLTANAATPYDRALALETYLRHFPYSLAVPAPPPNHDAVDYFLFDLKKGYCDYYATAMTVMARAAGLPARLVIGYASGTYDSYTAQYVIRQTDAHAWSEIYFSGIGWIEFEPTAGQSAPVRDGNSQVAPQLPPGTQNQPLWDKIPSFTIGRMNFPWLPITFLIFLYLLWIGSDGYRLSRHSPPEAVRRLFIRMRRLAQPFYGFPSPDQTVREYTIALTRRLESLRNRNRLTNWLLSPVQAQIGSLAELYMQSLFSRTALTPADTRHAIHIWGRLRSRLFLMKLVLVLRPGSVSR